MLTLRGNLTAGLVQVIKGKGVTALGLPAGLNAQIARLGDRCPAGPANRSSACQSIYIHTPKLAGAQPLPADAFLSGLSCAKCKACLLELAFVLGAPEAACPGSQVWPPPRQHLDGRRCFHAVVRSAPAILPHPVTVRWREPACAPNCSRLSVKPSRLWSVLARSLAPDARRPARLLCACLAHHAPTHLSARVVPTKRQGPAPADHPAVCCGYPTNTPRHALTTPTLLAQDVLRSAAHPSVCLMSADATALLASCRAHARLTFAMPRSHSPAYHRRPRTPLAFVPPAASRSV